MSEQTLLDALAPILASTYHPKLHLGIGDDAAIWQPSRSHRSVISSDVSVEGVHFRRAYATAQDIGYRALAVNLSDLAAMGARPVLATIALTLPRDVNEAWLVDAYRGMARLALRSRTALAGGDISRGAALSFAITVVGEVSPQRIKLRGNAHIRDVIAVTGALGRSRAGLALLDDPALFSRTAETVEQADALAAHRRPEPRLAYGKFLAASKHVHAMMDVSDGLAIDVARIARASACGVEIDAVPIAASALRIADAAACEARAWALGGGEDYELLCTVERRAFPHVAARFRKTFGATLHAVGRCIEGDRIDEIRDGVRSPLAAQGWDHLRASS